MKNKVTECIRYFLSDIHVLLESDQMARTLSCQEL